MEEQNSFQLAEQSQFIIQLFDLGTEKDKHTATSKRGRQGKCNEKKINEVQLQGSKNIPTNTVHTVVIQQML